MWEEQVVICRMLKDIYHNRMCSGGCVPFPPLLTWSQFETIHLFSKSIFCKRKVVSMRSEWRWDGICSEVCYVQEPRWSTQLEPVWMTSQDKLFYTFKKYLFLEISKRSEDIMCREHYLGTILSYSLLISTLWLGIKKLCFPLSALWASDTDSLTTPGSFLPGKLLEFLFQDFNEKREKPCFNHWCHRP